MLETPFRRGNSQSHLKIIILLDPTTRDVRSPRVIAQSLKRKTFMIRSEYIKDPQTGSIPLNRLLVQIP